VATIEEENNRPPTGGGISHAWRALRHRQRGDYGRDLVYHPAEGDRSRNPRSCLL